MTTSPQQVIKDLLELLLLTDAKAHSLLNFGWLLLKEYDAGDFQTEVILSKEIYELRIAEKIKAANKVMKSTSTEYWKCDPPKWKEDVNYIRLKRLLQGYIENEVDMDPGSECTAKCSDYHFAKQEECYDNNKIQFCAIQDKCEGRILNCRYYDNDADVYMSSDPARRYAYIEYEDGQVLGKSINPVSTKYKVDSWWRWIFFHCTFCFCICDDEFGKTERYFSLREVTSDIVANKIVVGVSLVKIDKVVHLMIHEAIAKGRGDVDSASLAPVPVDSFSVDDSVQDEDYMRMNYNNRALDLGDLKPLEGYVITGVRLRAVKSHLKLGIRVTPIDFESGVLDTERSKWIHNPSPENKFGIYHSDIPTESYLQSTPIDNQDQYIEFTHSSRTGDAAQTTVPYIDSQPVLPYPPQWLSSVGLYYKRSEGYGGFVGLKVTTYNLSSYVKKPNEIENMIEPENSV